MRQSLLALLILFSCTTLAQNFTKARRFASSGFDDIVSIRTDKNGSHYLYGYYTGTLNYTDTTNTNRTIASFGQRDIFIAKLNCNLQTVWINRIGSSANEGGAFLFGSITLDDSLNVYIAGTIGGNATFSSIGAANSNMTATGDDGFLAKYSNSGTLQWKLNIGSNINDEAHKVEWDSDNKLYVAGGYRGTCTFQTLSGTAITRTSNGSVDVFLAKYSTNGVIDTVIVSGGSQDEILFDILPDYNGHLYVSGNTCCSNSPFNIGPYSVTNQGNWGTFFFKISRNMQVSWLNVMGNVNSENLGALAMADSGRFYIFGHFNGSVSLPTQSPGTIQNFTAVGNLDVLIGKYDTSGVLISGKRFGTAGDEYASDVCVNSKFEPVITGRFSGTINFDSKSLATYGQGSNYMVHLDKNLVTLNALRAGGTGNDYSRALSLGINGEIIAAGNYTSPGTFGTFSLGALGNPDAFVTEINGMNSSEILTASNVRGSTTLGCDSVLLKLNYQYNTPVTIQWLRNNIPIAGATDTTLIAKLSGVYRVVITNTAICTSRDTSLPFTITSGHSSSPSSVNSVVCFGTNTVLNGTGTGNIQWTPTAGLSNPSILTPTINVTGNSTYVLQKTALNGCITSDTFNITAENCCFTCSTLPGTLGNGLVACYEFNGNANDGSGNNNHATIFGATLTTDRFNRPNRAYNFNGSSHYMSASNSTSLSSPTSDITMIFWVKVNAWAPQGGVNYASVFSKSSSSTTCQYRATLQSNGYSIINNGNVWTYTTGVTNNLNQWDFYAFSINGNAMTIHKNGTVVGTLNNPNGTFVFSSGNPLEMGRDQPGLTDYFNGIIDEMRIYNRALSTNEIQEIYTLTSSLALPTVNAGVDQSICSADSVQLNGSATNGVFGWSPVVGMNNAALLNPKVRFTGPANYVLTNTQGSCVISDTVSIKSIQVSVNAGSDTTICLGDSVQLNGTTSSGNFGWLGSGYISNSAVLNPYVKPTGTTTYYLRADSSGCITFDSVRVNVITSIVNAGTDKTTCAGDSVQLTASALGGSTYRWSSSHELSDSTTLNPHAKPLFNRSYVLLGNLGQCTSSDTVNVTISLPSAFAGTDTTICKFDSIQLNGSGTGTLRWSTKFGLADSTIGNTKASPRFTQTYVLKASIGNCAATDTMHIKVIQVEANAGSDRSACLGDTIHVNASATGSFVWSPTTNLNNPNIINPVATVLNDISYVLTASDSGCVQRDTVRFTVGSQLTISAGVDTFVCRGDSIQLQATGATNYQWFPHPSISDTSIGNPYVKPSGNTAYIVRAVLGSCEFYDTITVTVRSIPSIDAGTNQQICAGESVNLNATGTGQFSWQPSSGLSDSTIANPIATPASTTMYQVRVSDGFCSNTDSVQVTVIIPGSVDAGNDVAICEGQTTNLQASGATDVIWSPGSDLDDSTSLTPLAFPFVTTWFKVRTTNTFCPATDSVLVTVNPLPVVNAGIDSILCLGQDYILNGNVTGADQYSWQPATGLDDPTSLMPFFTASQPIIYGLTATNSATGCVATDSISIGIEDVNAAFTASPVEGNLPLSVAFANQSTGASSYLWLFGNGESSVEMSPVYVYTESGEYDAYLIAISERGCIDTATMLRIKVVDDIIISIPNVFTPNGDQTNEDFQVVVYNMDLLKYLKGSIWNRWGAKIYDFDMPGGKWWDGKHNGVDCAEGVYYYIIEAESLRGKEYFINGTITLLR